MAFLLSLEGVQRRDLHPRTEVFSALGQPVLMHGARPAWDQVQQPCRGVILPSCQVHDAGEFTWAPSASVLVMPHVLVNPQHPHPCETGGVIRCGLQARLDVGPHGVPRGCQLSGQAHDDQHCMTCTTRGSNGKIPLPSLPIDARLKLIVQPAPAAAGSGLDLYEELNVHRDHVQVTEAWHQD